jgi:phosphohistidine phosphatase
VKRARPGQSGSRLPVDLPRNLLHPVRVKTLLLMRHAKSSWRDGELADHERPLNSRGARAAPWMGKWLREQGLLPDQIVASTAVRAVDTAKAVALEIGYTGSLLLSPRLYMADVSAHLEVIGDVESTAGCLLIVGHNPGISETASTLTGVELDMPTAGLAWVELGLEQFSEVHDKTRGRLVQFQRPPKEDKEGKSSKKGKS